MEYQTIFVDFNNADPKGRVRLNTNGTINDIKTRGIILQEDKKNWLDDYEELKVLGTLRFSHEDNMWVAELNWNEIKHKTKKSHFEIFTEIMGWLQIFISPFLIGIIIGVIIYVSNPNSTGLFIGIMISVIGFIIGIVWATRVWKKRGTIHFISKIMGTQELDDFNKEKE